MGIPGGIAVVARVHLQSMESFIYLLFGQF